MVLLDIKKAYMQVRYREDLHKHQGVILKNGRRYEMTRLGFGIINYHHAGKQYMKFSRTPNP